MQLRGEFFNIFNRVNFLSDDGTVEEGAPSEVNDALEGLGES